LRVTGTQLFVEGSGGVGSTPNVDDRFATTLAAADFDGDGDGDLVAGAPYESVGTRASAGDVFVLDGTPGGLTGAGSRILDQSTPGVGSDPERGEAFGRSLAATRPTGG
jgi:hypothetical protein